MFLPAKILEEKLLKILAQDLGQGDLTTEVTIPEENIVEAKIIAREKGIVAGIEEIKILVKSLGLKSEGNIVDGQKIIKDQVIMSIIGNARIILSIERTLLNILSRMSGIATITREIVEKIQKAGLKTIIASTRKTAPGLLFFDKKAVKIGGGDTHRLHLDDMILIKDNHISIAGNVKEAIKRAKKASFTKKIEVEVTKIEEIMIAINAGVDIIMLDNFSPDKLEEAIELIKKHGFFGKILLEASGGITSENILTFARKKVDIISLGEITTSSKSLNISLEI
jgi:nicotinate-nucleotide pyrophosphorylase (carboxylating)